MLTGLLICFGTLIVFCLYRIDWALCEIAQYLAALRSAR